MESVADMKPVPPQIPGHPVRMYAENQPEYLALPTVVIPAPEYGEAQYVVSRWTLTDTERLRIAKGEDLYLAQLNFGTRLAPMRVGLRDTFVTEKAGV